MYCDADCNGVAVKWQCLHTVSKCLHVLLLYHRSVFKLLFEHGVKLICYHFQSCTYLEFWILYTQFFTFEAHVSTRILPLQSPSFCGLGCKYQANTQRPSYGMLGHLPVYIHQMKLHILEYRYQSFGGSLPFIFKKAQNYKW
jgi:hypothetical protein